MRDADLAADRALVAEWQRLSATQQVAVAVHYANTLAERLAVRLDELEELKREVERLRAPLPHPRGGLLR
jgi:hypothetical protein